MTAPQLKTYKIVIHEMLVHTTEIEAESWADALQRGARAWDDDTLEFDNKSLGRNQLISAWVQS
jgi:hypothetical protein